MVVGVGVGRKVSTGVGGVGGGYEGLCSPTGQLQAPSHVGVWDPPPPPKGLGLAWGAKEPLPVGYIGYVAPPPPEGEGVERKFPGVPPMEGMRPGDPGKFFPGFP